MGFAVIPIFLALLTAAPIRAVGPVAKAFHNSRFFFQDATSRPWTLNAAENRLVSAAIEERRFDKLNQVLFEARLKGKSGQSCEAALSAFRNPLASPLAVESGSNARFQLQYHSYYDYRTNQLYLGHMPLTSKLELPTRSREIVLTQAFNRFFGFLSGRKMDFPAYFYQLLMPFRVYIANAFNMILIPRYGQAAIAGAEWEFYSRIPESVREELIEALDEEGHYWQHSVPEIPIRFVRAGASDQENIEYNRKMHQQQVVLSIEHLKFKMKQASASKSGYVNAMVRADPLASRATIGFYFLLSTIQTTLQPWEWVKIIGASIATAVLLF